MKKKDAKDLIVWSQVSRVITGNDNSIRKNKVPVCYQEDVDELVKKVDEWLKKLK
ncbi:MAG: hypothetical protein ACI94Y_000556 [Maribacter sp.]|jgi:hypothetical protein